MKVTSAKGSHMAEDGLCILMGRCMRANGIWTRPRGLECISTRMERLTKVTGRKIFSRAKVLRNGLMDRIELFMIQAF
jgi:hypothetical protein